MLTNRAIAICALSVAAALMLGGLIGSAYQSRSLTRVVAEKDAEIAVLHSEVATLQARLAAQATSTTPISIAPSPTPTSPPNSAIRSAVLPLKNSSLCRNTIFTFSWKADAARVDEIRITIPNAPAPISPIADVPVSYNESGIKGEGSVEWRVGTGSFGMPFPGGNAQTIDLPDSDLYYARLEALQNGRVIEKKESGPFAVLTCEG